MRYALMVSMCLMIAVGTANAQIKSAKTGPWSADTTWVGGVVPTAANSVLIDTGTTVTIDVPVACTDLTVNGTLGFPDVANLSLTVNGSMSVAATGSFNSALSNTVTTARLETITIYKNLAIVSGGKFDMRRGSGALVGVGRVVFAGNTNSTISLSRTTYSSSIEEFNTVVINKIDGAKVILATGNLFQNNNATNSPDTLLFVSGTIETGANIWVQLSSSSGAVSGASGNCYVNGMLGRGLSNSAGTTRKLDVGSASGYRPITVQSTVSGLATGHYVWAKVIDGDANTGSSTLSGGIDKISTIRYVQVGYISGGGAASMSFCRFNPSYDTDDGVNAGNSDLRVAYSTDNRVTWTNIGPTTDTTSLAAPPTTIRSDSMSTALAVAGGNSLYVSLARANGTVTNPLGIVKAAIASLNTKRIDFGSIKIATTKNDSVTVTNAGNDTLKVSSMTSTSADFTVSSAAFTLAPAAAKTLVITFAPTTVGPKTGAVVLLHNGGSSPDTVQLSGTGDPTTSVSTAQPIPEVFALHQNYPNPFNPSTMIEFTVPASGKATLRVFNLLGQEVATLFSGIVAPGTVVAARFDASGLPSGMYIARLQWGSQSAVQKMLLTK